MSSKPTDAHAAISDAFVQARRSAQALPEYPGPLPATLEAAYAIQDLAIPKFGDRVVGWKIGMIAPAFRADNGGVERQIGPVFSRNLWIARTDTVNVFPAYAGGFAAVEAEFVVKIAHDLAPGEALADPLELVGALYFGMEPAGSPFSEINALGPRVTVSDFGNNHGLFVGPEIVDWRSKPASELAVTTEIDGELIGTGGMEKLPGGLAGALGFLVSLLARRGVALKAGDYVTTGAVTGVHRVDIGAQATLTLAGYPPLRFAAVKAEPFT